jgi:hypothetical protein
LSGPGIAQDRFDVLSTWDGRKPNKIMGCLPPITWWFGFLNHPFDVCGPKILSSWVMTFTGWFYQKSGKYRGD